MRRVCRPPFMFVGFLTAILFLYILDQSTLVSNVETKHRSTEQIDIKNEDNRQGTKFRSSSAKGAMHETWNVLMTLTNLDQHHAIIMKFEVCLSSICNHTSLILQLHIVTDERSQHIVNKVIARSYQNLCKDKVNIIYHDITWAAKALQPYIKVLEAIFTSGSTPYYSGALFFLSIITHNLFPNISKLIMLDADLKFRTDIVHLFDKFEKFSSKNIIGIAHEHQPVYKHITWKYRENNPGTRIGEPATEGYPGFNSGVLLLDLDRMRKSLLYQKHLQNSSLLNQLSEKYYFRGHLGDQDFYTLLSFEHPELFYILPCSWNRQLCVWWKNIGYENIFHLYHNCPGPVNIYHGNCNTSIPDD